MNFVKEKLYEEEELSSDDPINTEYLPSDESVFDPFGENNFETLESCNSGIEKDKNRREVTSSDDSPQPHCASSKKSEESETRKMDLPHFHIEDGIINSSDRYGWTRLHWSTFRGDLSKVKNLLSSGADVNSKDEHGFTPLFVASRMGHYAMVKVLCENNANLKCTNYQGKTAMNQAEEKDFIQIISLLNEYLED